MSSRPEPAAEPEAEGEIVISVRGLRNSFGEQIVHEDLDLEVRRGEILGVVGGSGTGKSVLMRSIIGLQTPDAGEVEVFGEPMIGRDEEEAKHVRRRWGVLFQGGALFSTLTVAENAAGRSRPSRLTVANPGSDRVTVYVPGRRSMTLYNPCVSVTTDRTFSMRTGLDASTVTPGSTSPLSSLTTPTMLLWATATAGTSPSTPKAITTTTANMTRGLISTSRLVRHTKTFPRLIARIPRRVARHHRWAHAATRRG